MHLTAGKLELLRGSFYNGHNRWACQKEPSPVAREKEKKDGNLDIHYFGRFGDRTLRV